MKIKNNFQIIGMFLTIFILFMCLSGCQDQYGNNNQFTGITLESNVVTLIDASLSFNKEYEYVNETDEYPTEVIKSVDVKYLFQNIANKDISVSIRAYLYDTNNNLIAICPENTYRVVNLPKDTSEKSYTPTNIISYNKANVTMVDHAKIIATEIS